MASVEYTHLAPGTEPPRLTGNAPFKAVVLVEAEVAPHWREAVSDWLVQSNCRYMMAWGHRCSDWDDSVDLAALAHHAPGEIPDDEYVMTTWHENETMREVFWFCQHFAAYPYIDLINTLIVHIASTARADEILADFRAARTLAEDRPR